MSPETTDSSGAFTGATQDSASDTLGGARHKAASGIDGAAAGIHRGADAIPGSAERVAGFAHATADKLGATADYIREHDSAAMFEDVKTMVKKNPVPALLGAAALGFLIAKAFSRE